MDLGRATMALTACVVVATAVLSGPLVGGVDLTPPTSPTAPPPGTGEADLRVERVPVDGLAFESGRFGADSYHLDGPPAEVRVADVEGNPTLRYVVDVPALDFTATRERSLAGTAGRTVRIRPGTGELSPRVVTNDSYTVRVAVWLRTGGSRYRTVYQETTTVEVRR